MKRTILVIGVIVAVFCITAVTATASEQVKLVIDGAEISTGPVQVRDGKVMAPVEDIAELLARGPEWDPQSESLIITPPGSKLNGPKSPQYDEIFQMSGRRTIEKTSSPEDVLLAYYEALYHACNLPEGNKVPISGTIGSGKDPYPDAYACWSREWRKKHSFEEYLKSWSGTVNVELLKLIPAGGENGRKKFFVETRNMEAIQDSNNPRMGVFCYKGYVAMENTDEGWRIANCQVEPEDPSWYVAGHQSWYADVEDVAQVIGMGVGVGTAEPLPRVVEYNDDGSITVSFHNESGQDTHRIVLVQTRDHYCQVISKEVVAGNSPADVYKKIANGILAKQQNDLSEEYYRGTLADLDNDGQEELILIYLDGNWEYYQLYAYKSKASVLLKEGALFANAGAAKGGLKLVDYDGEQNICIWQSNTEAGEKWKAAYTCELFDFKNGALILKHTFDFNYYYKMVKIDAYRYQGDVLRQDVVPGGATFLKDDKAISYEEFQKIRSILTNPINELCSVAGEQFTGFKLKDYVKN